MTGRTWAALAAAALVVARGAAMGVAEGDAAPPFSVRTVTGRNLDLAGLRGQVVVVNRWATWCVPCRAEFRMFDDYLRAHGQEGLTVVAIETGSVDPAAPLAGPAAMVRFPVVREDHAQAAAYPLVQNSVPTNYVVDRAGIVRYAKAGALTLAELDGIVRPLLDEPAAAAPRGGKR